MIGVVLLLPSSSITIELDQMTTEDLRLLYFDATQGYLAPHVARCFLNSLELHRELWGWEPSQPVTVLLVDLSDRGNAAAGAVPRNLLMLEIAPLSFVYEIVSANERMNWLMNHELVHIAAVDQAAGRDRFWRKFFGGKVQPIAGQPGDHPLRLPDHAPRRRPALVPGGHRGLRRDLDGGRHGARPGRLGRDGLPLDGARRQPLLRPAWVWSPRAPRSTSRSRSTPISTAPASCPTWRYEYGPETVIEWVSRRDGSKAYFAAQFEHVYGKTLDEAWADWIAWEHEFQQANLEAIRQYPIDARRRTSRRRRWARCRARSSTPTGARSTPRSTTPGWSPTWARSRWRTARSRRSSTSRSPSSTP